MAADERISRGLQPHSEAQEPAKCQHIWITSKRSGKWCAKTAFLWICKDDVRKPVPVGYCDEM